MGALQDGELADGKICGMRKQVDFGRIPGRLPGLAAGLPLHYSSEPTRHRLAAARHRNRCGSKGRGPSLVARPGWPGARPAASDDRPRVVPVIGSLPAQTRPAPRRVPPGSTRVARGGIPCPPC